MIWYNENLLHRAHFLRENLFQKSVPEVNVFGPSGDRLRKSSSKLPALS